MPLGIRSMVSNAMSTTRDHSSGFLAMHGYGPAQLRALLARVDWSRADSLLRAKTDLTLFLATCVEIVAAAGSKRRSVGALVGELAVADVRQSGADAEQDERALLWLVVRYAAGSGRIWSVPPARMALLEGPGAALHAAHWRLLETGTVAPMQLPLLIPGQPQVVLQVAHRVLRAKFTVEDPRVVQHLLRLVAALAADKPRLLLHSAQHLLHDEPTHGRLAYDFFRKLPAALRRTILFTPAFAACFLDTQARAAALPPSPAFDPLYIDKALEHLAGGRLSHVDVDALFMGSRDATVRARMVAALAHGSGRLDCPADVRERLISAADVAEWCLVACAAAAGVDDMRRALARQTQLPTTGVLGKALQHFAMIACVAAADDPMSHAENRPADRRRRQP